MKTFCRQHNKVEDYQPFFQRWTDEEMANIALTLCYMTDSMLNKFLLTLENEFVEQGGIKERMHSARTGYRKQQDEEFAALKEKVKEQILKNTNGEAVICYLGGYGDFDEICARACRELKRAYKSIELVYVMPYITASEQEKVKEMIEYGFFQITFLSYFRNNRHMFFYLFQFKSI